MEIQPEGEPRERKRGELPAPVPSDDLAYTPAPGRAHDPPAHAPSPRDISPFALAGGAFAAGLAALAVVGALLLGARSLAARPAAPPRPAQAAPVRRTARSVLIPVPGMKTRDLEWRVLVDGESLDPESACVLKDPCQVELPADAPHRVESTLAGRGVLLHDWISDYDGAGCVRASLSTYGNRGEPRFGGCEAAVYR